MITSPQWDDLVYRNPQKALEREAEKIDKIIGIDSEAYSDGVPFMYCTPDEDILPKQIPGIFFQERYLGANFVIWNMKYDSGALLYFLPKENMHELWETGETKHDGYRYQYIPHKLLRIWQSAKEFVSFWDISQFYKSSLDKASKVYLNEGKMEMRTKRFSRIFVKYFRGYIRKYCKRDALLTERLGKYLVDKFDEFGIVTPSLYSCASISFQYFRTHTDIITSWRFYKSYSKLLQMACDSYEGGKFEVTSRGSFTGYEYDLTSAYPYEIANLIDISRARVVYSKSYVKEAVYGFLRVRIDNTSQKHIPCGIMIKGVRIYPAGRFFLTITKEEYDYMMSIGIGLKIIDASWLVVDRIRYPYKKIIDTLFSLKSSFKNIDKMQYSNAKTIMNSFYGKCVQVIKNNDGKLIAGAGWNPIYGSVITARTRIKVTAIQNLLGDDCYAVHTDSVMTKYPIPEKLITGKLGDFEFVENGNAILVACGMYQLGDANATKGFRMKRGDSWTDLLSNNKNKKVIAYPVLHVESWVEAMAKNHATSTINLFADTEKLIDLNCDVKRIWRNPVTGGDLLEGFQKSVHKIVMQPKPPGYWQ